MVTATERVMGWSGLDTERVLASPRAESACWAAAMVAETWSAGAASVLAAAYRSIWFIAAAVASTFSERTDISEGVVWRVYQEISCYTFTRCLQTYWCPLT